MQKMCLRCRSESYEKEIDLDQYMFGAGSASVLPGSGEAVRRLKRELPFTFHLTVAVSQRTIHRLPAMVN